MTDTAHTDINADNVLQYLRKNLEPVPYKMLIAHFCEALDTAPKQDEAKTRLNKVLVTSINSGAIMHCNNHFFAGTHAEDMEGVIDLTQIEDISPNLSSISFSSCESILSTEEAKKSEVFGEASDTNDASEADGDGEGEGDEDRSLKSTSNLNTQSNPEVFQFASHTSSLPATK